MSAVILLLVVAGYFLPTIIAISRHHRVGPVVVVDLLLGWTFIGWVVALAMAVGDKDRVVVNIAPPQAPPAVQAGPQHEFLPPAGD